VTRRACPVLAVIALVVLSFARTSRSSAFQGSATCPVTGVQVTPGESTPSELVNGTRIFFCCNDCVKTFRAEPEKFLILADKGKCPVMGNPARAEASLRLIVNNRLYYFCCPACPALFASKPASYFQGVVDPVTHKAFSVGASSPHEVYRGQHYFFSSPETRARFDQAPDQFVVIFGEKDP
jgi:YHS domain-containing protein